MRQTSSDFVELQLFLYKGFEIRLYSYGMRSSRTSFFERGGGNVTVLVLAFYITWSRVLARASIGGVGRQNSVFMYELNLVNNFFFL